MYTSENVGLRLSGLALSLLLTGCTGMGNHDPVDAAAKLAMASLPTATDKPVAQLIDSQVDEILLSPGDRLRILVDDGTPFSGIFQVDLDGQLHVPYLKALPAVGRSITQLQENLVAALVNEGLFQPGYARASINILQWAPIQISVSGAVFQPGRVLLNDLQGARAKDPHLQIAQESGDYPVQRFLSYALKGAAGIKPTADLRHIKLIRGGISRDFDLSGVFGGKAVNDVPLIAGDEIVVPGLDRVQVEYIRPSQITPPGFELLYSNLSQPVTGHTSTVMRQERSIAYGSRLSLGLMAANCVGGTEMINADRDAVLVSRNVFTGQMETRKYSVPEVIANANDTTLNPYLMPGDSLACFDSTVVNARETMKTIADMMSPFIMLMLLL